MTITFSGSKDGGETFWARVGPKAAEALDKAAIAALTDQVLLTFYDPEAGHLMKRPYNADKFCVHYNRDGNLKHVATVRGGVLDLNRDALIRPDGARRATGFIRMGPGADIWNRLRTAATLTRMGHDVTLFATEDGFHVGFTTDSCSCYACKSTTTTTTTERTAA